VSDDREKQLSQLRQAHEQGILDESTYQAAVAALGAGAEAQAANVGSGAIAQAGGTAAGEHGVAVGHDVHGHVIVVRVDAGRMDPERLLQAVSRRTPDRDLERATDRYLEYLVDRYRYLDFRGMGVSDRVPLLELYIPLKARVGTPEGETWARELKVAGRRVSEHEAEAMGRRVSEPQPVLNLLALHDGLVVLGDPGAARPPSSSSWRSASPPGRGMRWDSARGCRYWCRSPRMPLPSRDERRRCRSTASSTPIIGSGA
jgi:hypothetical protein